MPKFRFTNPNETPHIPGEFIKSSADTDVRHNKKWPEQSPFYRPPLNQDPHAVQAGTKSTIHDIDVLNWLESLGEAA